MLFLFVLEFVILKSPIFFILSSACIDSFLVMRNTISFFSCSRFRHLPFHSLSSLVGSLIFLAHPPGVTSLLVESGQLMPSPSVDRAPAVQSILREGLRAVIPDTTAVDTFRDNFDPLFCLELLTSAVCVRLHVEEMAVVTHTRSLLPPSANIPTASHRQPTEMRNFPSEPVADSCYLRTTSNNNVWITNDIPSSNNPTPKASFSNTLWPLVVSYLETALRWFLVPGIASRLPRIIPLDVAVLSLSSPELHSSQPSSQSHPPFNKLTLQDGKWGTDGKTISSTIDLLSFLNVLDVTTLQREWPQAQFLLHW